MAAPPPLWSDTFLSTEITDLPEYQELLDAPDEFEQFVDTVRELLASMSGAHNPDEALTIQLAIEPTLKALGWPQTLPARMLTSSDEVGPDLVRQRCRPGGFSDGIRTRSKSSSRRA